MKEKKSRANQRIEQRREGNGETTRVLHRQSKEQRAEGKQYIEEQKIEQTKRAKRSIAKEETKVDFLLGFAKEKEESGYEREEQVEQIRDLQREESVIVRDLQGWKRGQSI